MISSASPHTRMIIATVLAGAAVLAALWVLAISPKRAESAEVRDNVVAQEQRLSAAKSQLAGYEEARKAYPRHVQSAAAPRQGGAGSRRDLDTAARAAEAGQRPQQRSLRLAAANKADHSGGASSRAAGARRRLTPGAGNPAGS